MTNTTAPTTIPASLRALLAGIVDYAGLFPPARLGMDAAVARYAEALAGPEAWMLGRFVLPAARLEEFERAAADRLDGPAGPWRLSALAGLDMEAELAALRDFNARNAGRATVDSVEIRAADEGTVERTGGLLPAGIVAYFEIAADTDPAPLVAAVARAGARAKIRTGGVTPDAFPAPTDVLRFLGACVEAGIPLKATAGLHHPLRSTYPLTYEPDAPAGTMFGFLNVFLAAALLRAGVDAQRVAPLLEESVPGALRFTDEGVEWRGHRLTTGQLRAAREGFAVSFGSCSFDEPVRDLKALNLL